MHPTVPYLVECFAKYRLLIENGKSVYLWKTLSKYIWNLMLWLLPGAKRETLEHLPTIGITKW